MIDRVKELAANYSDEVVAIRRHLHNILNSLSWSSRHQNIYNPSWMNGDNL